jgi:hypothetical protein
MKFFGKNRKFIAVIFIGVFSLYFSCASVALAGEINKDNIIYLVNQSRTENSLGALKENENLDQAAKDKLDDMIKNNYFAHTSPSGIVPWHWFEKNNYDYQYAGENLALGFSTVENEHQAWMDSPTHRKNILNPNYEEIGVAVGKGNINNNLVMLAVQLFGSRFNEATGVKEESNISDDKAQEQINKNKDEKKGVVLNTESSGSNTPFSGSPVGSGNNSSNFMKTLFQDKGFLNNSIWITSITILALCLVMNILVAMMLVFHNLVNHLRRNRDAFTVVHSILILLLVGFFIF